jgi:hypothetical protein
MLVSLSLLFLTRYHTLATERRKNRTKNEDILVGRRYAYAPLTSRPSMCVASHAYVDRSTA